MSPEEAQRLFAPRQVRVEVSCLNCARVFEVGHPYLYCSEWCKDFAGDVRWARRKRRERTLQRLDIQETLRIRVAWLAAGGYPEQRRRVSPAIRAQVRARGDHCEKCGAAFDDRAQAFTIQHLRGSSNALDNLAAFCGACNRQAFTDKLVPVSPTNTRALEVIAAFERRYRSRWPLQACDDEDRWDRSWRQISHQRRLGDSDMTGFLDGAWLRRNRERLLA